jgi:hypothetical protein
MPMAMKNSLKFSLDAIQPDAAAVGRLIAAAKRYMAVAAPAGSSAENCFDAARETVLRLVRSLKRVASACHCALKSRGRNSHRLVSVNCRHRMPSTISVCVALLTSLAVDCSMAQSFSASYGGATRPELLAILSRLKEKHILENIASSFSKGIQLPSSVNITAFECGSQNAFYSRETSTIIICLELLEFLSRELAPKLREALSNNDSNRALSAVMRFVTFHELAHALIHKLDVPVLGREEDAADQIATFFMLRSRAAESEIAAAGLLFQVPSLAFTRRHFASEHALPPQRQANLACWAFGFDQRRFSYFVGTESLPIERATKCKDEYEQLDSSVRRLLSPSVKLPKK